jgi:hypothetical protein
MPWLYDNGNITWLKQRVIKYVDCQATDPDIYFCEDDDPESEVIAIGDICYERVGCVIGCPTSPLPVIDDDYEDCETCDGGGEPPAPCSCPGGLAASYTVGGFIMDEQDPCDYQGDTPSLLVAGAGLYLNTTACCWEMVVDFMSGCIGEYEKCTGLTPAGTYVKTSGGGGCPATIEVT